MTAAAAPSDRVITGSPAPCRAACPVGTDASAYVALMDEGRFADAYDVARRTNPFVSVCGRICSAPCERACRRGIVDSSVSIRALKRVLCDSYGASLGASSRWMRAVGPLPAATRGHVGIIGAGPAGLAAAHDLRRLGFAVTVYEAMPAAGGMMRYGIPAFRLPRDLLAAEIDAITSLGIEIHFDCAIGASRTFTSLLETHDAVLITVGCQEGRGMSVPGAQLPGVIRAVDYLREVSPAGAARARDERDGAVVVVGGGSVAFDVARSAWRSRTTTAYDGQTVLDVARSAVRGAVSSAAGGSVAPVTLVAPESREQLSVPADELHEALVEGVTMRDGYGVVRILGDAYATGVEIAPVQSLYDADGHFHPTLDVAQSTTVAATTVVLAIGQQSNTDFLADTQIQRTPSGGVVVDANMRSSDARVWAAGDVATGPRDLIDAIAAGQRAAASIARELGAVSALSSSGDAALPVAAAPMLRRPTRFWSGYTQRARAPLPVLPTAARDGTREVEQMYSIDTARVEASRCLRCDEHMQFAVERCVGCGLCVDVCPQTSLALLPAGRGALALVFNDDSCIRCGLCVHRCPTDALWFDVAPARSPLDGTELVPFTLERDHDDA
ncbi:MAG: FAD-dependent oxidoreductase [Gemmatimonadaceae bacterium]|nr:FAD-dependent oxidoreductase [Gemmatimonadaceae bacterium]